MVNRLNNINLLNREQYNGIPEPSKNELWAVETPVVVETYRNGMNWYRVYSDGWIEQSGFVDNGTALKTVTLLKPFIDTNYTVLVTSYHPTGDQTLYHHHVDSFTTTTFKAAAYGERGGATNTNGTQLIWYACGYGA